MAEQNLIQQNDRSAHVSLDSFYADVLNKKFSTSVEAIDYCRKLCAQFGFTIKQEQSTYRNIYVYCSREGFPDSLRNPKSNPKRRRPSKRCDCKWRITLNEHHGSFWEFRKSLNPDASSHNHELMRPEEIDSGWPKEMLDLISELTRQRMATPDIRSRVQVLYAHIPWNERRFYNRLSEERQKLRVADAQARVQQLQGIWSNLVTATAASQELTDMAVTELNRIVDQLCGITQTDPSTLPTALQKPDDLDVDDDVLSSQDAAGDSSQDEASKPIRKQGNSTPKGYTAVVIPQQIYYIKLHPQRVLQDVQQLNRRRSRSFAFSDSLNTADASPSSSTSSSLSNQQKKQKTPLIKEIAHQHQQPSVFSNRQGKPSQELRYLTNEQPSTSSGFMYPSSSQRDANYCASTLYPMYPTQRYMATQQYQQQPPLQQEYHDSMYPISSHQQSNTVRNSFDPTTTPIPNPTSNTLPPPPPPMQPNYMVDHNPSHQLMHSPGYPMQPTQRVYYDPNHPPQ